MRKTTDCKVERIDFLFLNKPHRSQKKIWKYCTVTGVASLTLKIIGFTLEIYIFKIISKKKKITLSQISSFSRSYKIFRRFLEIKILLEAIPFSNLFKTKSPTPRTSPTPNLFGKSSRIYFSTFHSMARKLMPFITYRLFNPFWRRAYRDLTLFFIIFFPLTKFGEDLNSACPFG